MTYINSILCPNITCCVIYLMIKALFPAKTQIILGINLHSLISLHSGLNWYRVLAFIMLIVKTDQTRLMPLIVMSLLNATAFLFFS